MIKKKQKEIREREWNENNKKNTALYTFQLFNIFSI